MFDPRLHPVRFIIHINLNICSPKRIRGKAGQSYARCELFITKRVRVDNDVCFSSAAFVYFWDIDKEEHANIKTQINQKEVVCAVYY